MKSLQSITIIGGGLAGLTLGIALRQHDVPVELWESGHYPRHRVCGEFICGRGRATLAHLGLDDLLHRAGAREASTAAFHAPKVAGPVRSLPEPALCLSRYSLDASLAGHFRTLGGQLHEGRRWQNDTAQTGVVHASGRRAETHVNGWRWFGLKTHARDVKLDADLEMHLAPDGYVGLCRIADDTVNVCGLFRRNHAGAAQAPAERLRGVPGTLLHERLGRAQFIPETQCAVAGLNLLAHRARDAGECRVGDALTMIPPFTGNGMSMAIESADVALEPLEQWSRGNVSWQEARDRIARRCDERFNSRLAWAARLHSLMFLAPLQPALVTCLPLLKTLWDFLFSRTR